MISVTPAIVDTPVDQGVAGADKYCVFRSGSGWFALPASCVGELLLRPQLISVPLSHRVLAGLCNVRNEFVPTMLLGVILGDRAASESSESHILVMNHSSVAWALLIERAVSLETLDISFHPECQLDSGLNDPIVGTATYREYVLRVLEPNILYRLTEQLLHNDWTTGFAKGTNR